MSTSRPERAAPRIRHWILIVGGIGFAAGFLGPMALVPEANQGPLLGIFISGPASTALAVFLFIVLHIARVRAAHQWRVLWTSSALVGLTTLFYCLPEPAYKGYILDAVVQSCSTPADGADDAIAYWEKRVAGVTWAAPRAGWRSDTRRILRNDAAAVLSLTDTRSNRIYENRKPWNHGSSTSQGWQASADKSYYVSGSCAEFPVASRIQRFALYDADIQLARGPTDWPPRDPAVLLDLETLAPIPARYEQFAPK